MRARHLTYEARGAPREPRPCAARGTCLATSEGAQEVTDETRALRMRRCDRAERDNCARAEHFARARRAIGSITVVQRYAGDGRGMSASRGGCSRPQAEHRRA